GATVVEPVHDGSRLDLPGLRIPREDLERQATVDNLADLHARAVGQDHASVIVQTSEHDAYLLADLIDEDEDGPRARDGRGELPKRLRHETRLQARQRVANVAVELGARHER